MTSRSAIAIVAIACSAAVIGKEVANEHSAAAQLQRRRRQRREADADPSTEGLAKQVQTAFAKILVGELQKMAMPAETAPATDQAILGLEADTSRLAKAVAQQIKGVMMTQKWIMAEQPQAQ